MVSDLILGYRDFCIIELHRYAQHEHVTRHESSCIDVPELEQALTIIHACDAQESSKVEERGWMVGFDEKSFA